MLTSFVVDSLVLAIYSNISKLWSSPSRRLTKLFKMKMMQIVDDILLAKDIKISYHAIQ